MTGRWRRLWRDLLGRGDALFVELLREQASVATTAARTLSEAQRGRRGTVAVRDELVALEQHGDDTRTRLLEELARALTTPIDSEDLFRLSRSLDDVLDNLRDFAIELDCYGAEPQERFLAPLDALGQGLEELSSAIARLDDGVANVAGPARAAKKANDAREAFHDEMSVLLSGEEVTMTTLRDRELLRRLDVAGLRLGEAADALISGALKRG